MKLNTRKYLTESKNTHMTHLEDSVFLQGVKGTRQAIEYVQQMRDTLNGHASTPLKTSTKWDGAPAIFIGADPTDGKFFVAKKGLFNKTPLVYKSLSEIDQASELPGELKTKFKLAFTSYQNAGIKNVIQGDFLFDSQDLKKETIEGEEVVTFHPNTIVYAIPYATPLGKKVMKSKMGIVWHTTYNGNTIDSLTASYGVKMPTVGNDVFQVDAMYTDVSGSASFTAKQSVELSKKLTTIGTLFRAVSAKAFSTMSQPEISRFALTYTNSFIRTPQKITGARAAVGFVHYMTEYFKKEMDKRKTPKGKDGVKLVMVPIMKMLTQIPKPQLVAMFELYFLLQESKQILIAKLNSSGFTKTFLKTSDGYKVTGQEGWVAIDHLGTGAVKIVDRLEFSYANFSPEIIKGWQSSTRN
jgi:hypothetical protein